ncbi:MAG: hypothetical protein OXC94_02325 [Chloroflexi bacterium]|nr:hypothetical protein [Chloroflexota bacterium]
MSKKPMPSASARARPTTLLPEASGPSIAMLRLRDSVAAASAGMEHSDRWALPRATDR